MISRLTVREALSLISKQLEEAGVPSASRDARLLLAKAMGLDPTRLTLHLAETVDQNHANALQPFLGRRSRREPMSHILGERQFYGRSFKVTADVLDPRPETETLIQLALEETFEKVLDLGTGSGCILLSLLAERETAVGVGADVSVAALKVAQENAVTLEVDRRCSLECSNWFAQISGRFDLIVSNPPYIAADEFPDLQTEVRDFEPRLALTDEADGLSCYREIIGNHDPFLRPGGRLIVEIGPTQGEAVRSMMEAEGLIQCAIKQDLDARDRVVIGRKPRNSVPN